jgi:hypothetical protein
MDEPVVFGHVIEELDDRGYQPLVHVPGDVIRANVLFNFVQQLKHIGVLDGETRSHSGKIREYDPDSKPWLLRDPNPEP